MKFINLTPMDIKRLKAYRKVLNARIGAFELCNCGSLGCDYTRCASQSNPNYVNLRTVLDRVNKELGIKQRASEIKSNPFVPPLVKQPKKIKSWNPYSKRPKNK